VFRSDQMVGLEFVCYIHKSMQTCYFQPSIWA